MSRFSVLMLIGDCPLPRAAPGEASWPAVDLDDCIVQTAIFVPRGLAGALYWYLLYPLHALIFSDLARAIKGDAVKRERDA